MKNAWIRKPALPHARIVNKLIPSLLFAPDTGAGGGEDEDDDDTPVASGGSSAALVQAYEAKLFRLREKNRVLKQERDTAQQRVAPEGAVVLTGKDAERWQVVKDWKDDPAAVLAERDQSKQQLAGFEREKKVRAIADPAGLNADALLALPGLPDMSEKEVVGADGKTAKHAVVTIDGKEQPLVEWGRAAYPALWVAVEAKPQQPAGQRFVQQDAGGKPATTDYVTEASQRMQAQRDSAPNPLKPA